MKRNFKLLVAVLVLAVMVFTLASCDVMGGVVDKFMPHEHEYSADWSSDETNHWHAAICDDAEPADLAAHTFVEDVCSVCGYDKSNDEKPACAHEACTAEVVKEATCTEAGEKKFTCTDCGYSYSQEIAIVDHTVEKLDMVDPTCTETGLSKGEKCSVCGETLKAQTVIDTIAHEFVDGLCSFGCGTVAEGYAWVDVVYTLLPDELDEFVVAKEDEGKRIQLGTDDFFTVICKEKTKIDYFDSTNHTTKDFEDGFSAAKRLSLNGKVNWKDGVITKTGMQITVNGDATIKIWWVSGGDGRYVAIQDVTKGKEDFVAKSAKTDDVVSGELFIDTFEVPAGSYYIGNHVGNNYYAKIEVTTKALVKVEDQKPAFNGSGTDSDPYVLPTLGEYTCAYPGGYDLVWYQVTAPSNGYVTVSSNWNGAAWLKVGTNIYAAESNSGSGAPISTFALAGETVYIGVADWDAQANEIPFTVSFEEVTLGSVEAFVGSWKLEVEDWSGITTYIFNINEDGTGTAVEKGGWATYNYTLSTVVVEGVAIVTLVDDDNNSYVFNFTYNSEADSYTAVNNMIGINGELLPYDGETDEPNLEVSYDTVIVIGANTLFFSEDEIAAGAANRTLTISVAGNYMFKGDLFVSSIVDSNGNAITKNADYSYTIAEGEYTVSFGMFSIFGVQADAAYGLNVEEVVSGGDTGGGDDGDDGEETYTEPFDTLKDSLSGEYIFDNYHVFMMYNGFDAAYYANVCAYDADGNTLYDLYFTYELTESTGGYLLTLTYVSRPDYEVGKDYVNTVLGYQILIGSDSAV